MTVRKKIEIPIENKELIWITLPKLEEKLSSFTVIKKGEKIKFKKRKKKRKKEKIKISYEKDQFYLLLHDGKIYEAKLPSKEREIWEIVTMYMGYLKRYLKKEPQGEIIVRSTDIRDLILYLQEKNMDEYHKLLELLSLQES